MRDHVFCTFFFITFHIQSFVLQNISWLQPLPVYLVDWILFTKAHDVSTKRPIGESQVFLLFSFIQKFAVQIWMTRIKWWKAGVNASFVLLALRKYLRAKECILWWNGFSWDQCFFTLFFQTFYNKTFTDNHQLITI